MIAVHNLFLVILKERVLCHPINIMNAFLFNSENASVSCLYLPSVLILVLLVHYLFILLILAFPVLYNWNERNVRGILNIKIGTNIKS